MIILPLMSLPGVTELLNLNLVLTLGAINTNNIALLLIEYFTWISAGHCSLLLITGNLHRTQWLHVLKLIFYGFGIIPAAREDKRK